MHESRAIEYRTWGLRIVTVLVVLSFAFIPVRCDASTAPHSIFVDPVTLASDGHAHHAAEQEAAGEHAHHHHAGMSHATDVASVASDPMQDLCALSLGAGADASSQQPVGAALDLPVTPVPPSETALLSRDDESLLRFAAPAAMHSEIAVAPDAPPPKSF